MKFNNNLILVDSITEIHIKNYKVYSKNNFLIQLYKHYGFKVEGPEYTKSDEWK